MEEMTDTLRGRPRKPFSDKVLEYVNFGMRLSDCQNMTKAMKLTGKTKRDILREALEMYVKWLEKKSKL